MRQGDQTCRVRFGARDDSSRLPGAWLAALVMLAAVLSCGDDSPTLPSAGLGDIQISLTTTGGDVDLDGYVVTVDGVAVGPIASDGSLKLTGLASGQRLVGLNGVAANCQVTGSHPRAVALLAGRVASVQFSVACLTTGITVIVEQTGADLDPDGFTISVDGSAELTVSSSTPKVVSRLEPGTHTVSIGGLASNCSVNGSVSRNAAVAVGALTEVRFTVSCLPVTGSIAVTAVTSGEDLDPDGYYARIDGGAAHAVTANGTTIIGGLAAGDRTVQLESITGNCRVLGESARQATVTPGLSTTVAFQVTCERADMIAFVKDGDIAGRIHLAHADGSTVVFLADGSEPAWSPDGRRIVYRRFTCGYGAVYYWGSYCFVLGLYVTRIDTVAPSQLTDMSDGPPDWSPDGTMIAFTRWTGLRWSIHIMTASGAGVTRIDITGFEDSATDVVWSPDGTRFAFQCYGPTYVDICVVNKDGTGFQRFLGDAAFDGHPAWSPDGTQIAFTTVGNRVGHYRIALIGADGTGFREFADGQQPSWSPDGSRLVFRGEGIGSAGLAPSLYLINADGSGLVRLTMGASDYAPAWRR